MGYISKLDTKFITFINRKYGTTFKYFDDYIVWLYKAKNDNKEHYYTQLEKDIWEYSDYQTGTPRSNGRSVVTK
jgi:hypothetical protein